MSIKSISKRSSWLIVLLLLMPVAGYAQQATEHAVKAAVVHKITKFVSWPEDAFQSNKSPIRFCVAGSEPLRAALTRLQVHEVHGRSFLVRGVADPVDASGGCDVLYLSDEGVSDPSLWVHEIADKPVLTFGESKKDEADSSIVTISINRNKVRFDINVAASERARLNISAQLLQLAALTNNRRR